MQRDWWKDVWGPQSLFVSGCGCMSTWGKLMAMLVGEIPQIGAQLGERQDRQYNRRLSRLGRSQLQARAHATTYLVIQVTPRRLRIF